VGKEEKGTTAGTSDAPRFLGARSRLEGQSNGVKSPRVATRDVTKPWKLAGRAGASHFPLRISLRLVLPLSTPPGFLAHPAPLSVPLCFPCFPVEQAREFSRFSDVEI